MSEFRIGDRVRYTGKSKSYKEERYIGCTGEVVGLFGGVQVRWDKSNKLDPGEGAKYPENLELIYPKTFEIGKKYRNHLTKDSPIYTVEAVINKTNEVVFTYYSKYQEKITSSVISSDFFNNFTEVKPEDWRCLHNTGDIPSLGGIPYKSESEVILIYRNSPNFIKAVRVDA